MKTSAALISAVLALSALACDAKKDEPLVPAKTKSISELTQEVKETRTPEELKQARREEGFIDPEEAAKANIAAMEKGEREFIKTRLDKYKKMAKGLRKHIDDVDKAAKAWADAKDPQKAFDKFKPDYEAAVKEFWAAYNELSENGIRGGNLAAQIGKALRAWTAVNGDLGPEVAKAASFDESIKEIRALIDDVDKDLEAIANDDTLKANPDADADDTDSGDAEAEDAKARGKKVGK